MLFVPWLGDDRAKCVIEIVEDVLAEFLKN